MLYFCQIIKFSQGHICPFFYFFNRSFLVRPKILKYLFLTATLAFSFNISYSCSWMLIQEITQGSLKAFKYWVEEKNVNPHLQNSDVYNPSWSAIHYAAFHGKLDIVQYLIEKHKIDPNIKTNLSGQTPICFAAQWGHLDIVQYLIETCGANPNLQNNDGETPLHCATEGGRLAIVQYLIEKHKVKLNIKENIHGRTPIHFAAQFGRLDITKYLLETCNINPNGQDDDDWTPIDYAARNSRLDIIQYLIEKHRVDLKNDSMRLIIRWHMTFNLEFFERYNLLKIFLETPELSKIKDQNNHSLSEALIAHPAALSSMLGNNWNLHMGGGMHSLNKQVLTKEQKGCLLIDLLRKALILSKNERKVFANNFANTYLTFKIVAGLSVKGNPLPDDCAAKIMGFSRYCCNKNPKSREIIQKLREKSRKRNRGEKKFYATTGVLNNKRQKI